MNNFTETQNQNKTNPSTRIESGDHSTRLRWAIYLRSANPNPERLIVERLRCEEYVTMRAGTLVGVYLDDGVVAHQMDRPGLNKLMAAVRAGEVDAVVVPSVSALARQTRALAEVFADLAGHDVEVATLDWGRTDIVTGTRMADILSAFSDLRRGPRRS